MTSSRVPSATSSTGRSEEHTSELQSPCNLVCRLLLEKKKNNLPQVRIPPHFPSLIPAGNQTPHPTVPVYHTRPSPTVSPHRLSSPHQRLVPTVLEPRMSTYADVTPIILPEEIRPLLTLYELVVAVTR